MDIDLIKAPGRSFTTPVVSTSEEGYDCGDQDGYFRVWWDVQTGDDGDYTVARVGDPMEPLPGWQWAINSGV